MAIQRQVFRKDFFSILLVLGPMSLCLFLPAESRSSIQIKKVIVVEYYENCENKIYPITCYNFTFTRNGTVLVANGDEIVYRDSKDQISAQFRIEKCKDKANPDTCEYYNTWKWDDVCTFLKIMPFSARFIHSHTPPLSCPFKKNHYHFRNASVETNMFIRFLSPGDSNRVLWKFHTPLLERGQLYACVDFAIRVANIRVKQ